MILCGCYIFFNVKIINVIEVERKVIWFYRRVGVGSYIFRGFWDFKVYVFIYFFKGGVLVVFSLSIFDRS